MYRDTGGLEEHRSSLVLASSEHQKIMCCPVKKIMKPSTTHRNSLSDVELEGSTYRSSPPDYRII